MRDKTLIDLTGEVVLNYSVLPPSIEGWQRYRVEYWEPGERYPFELGPIYLPPEIDPTAVVNAMNGYEVYRELNKPTEWVTQTMTHEKEPVGIIYADGSVDTDLLGKKWRNK